MEDKKPQTIAEEAGLPENWVPVNRPPIVPSTGYGRNPTPALLQGSLAPGYQHDTSFVDTAINSPSVTRADLMPLGVQGNPATNAAIQSTSSITPSSVPPVTAVTLTLDVPNIFNPTTQTVNLPGIASLGLASQLQNLVWASPDGLAGLPVFRALVVNDLPVVDVPHGGTGLATLPAHEILVGEGTSAVASIPNGTTGQILTSNGAGVDPSFQNAPVTVTFVVYINGVGKSLDKKFWMNGVSDGAAAWGVSINGTADGG